MTASCKTWLSYCWVQKSCKSYSDWLPAIPASAPRCAGTNTLARPWPAAQLLHGETCLHLPHVSRNHPVEESSFLPASLRQPGMKSVVRPPAAENAAKKSYANLHLNHNQGVFCSGHDVSSERANPTSLKTFQFLPAALLASHCEAHAAIDSAAGSLRAGTIQ